MLTTGSLSQAADKMRIQIWHQMIYGHRQVLAEAIQNFEKENPDITIQATYRETEELRSSYQAAAMGGSGPELVFGPSDQIGPFATMGIIRPLDEVYGPEHFANYDSLATPLYQDKHYMIGSMAGNHLTLIYNKKLVSAPPKSSAELIEMGKKLTVDENGDGKIDRYGLVFNYTEPFFIAPFIPAFGEAFMKNGIEPQLNTEAVRKTFQYILDLRDKHKVIPKECDYETANALFKQGKAAMIINGDWSWGDYKEIKMDFGITAIPMISETERWPSPLVGTAGYSLNVNVKDPSRLAATLRVLNYLTSEKTQLLFTERVGTLPSLSSKTHTDPRPRSFMGSTLAVAAGAAGIMLVASPADAPAPGAASASTAVAGSWACQGPLGSNGAVDYFEQCSSLPFVVSPADAPVTPDTTPSRTICKTSLTVDANAIGTPSRSRNSSGVTSSRKRDPV